VDASAFTWHGSYRDNGVYPDYELQGLPWQRVLPWLRGLLWQLGLPWVRATGFTVTTGFTLTTRVTVTTGLLWSFKCLYCPYIIYRLPILYIIFMRWIKFTKWIVTVIPWYCMFVIQTCIGWMVFLTFNYNSVYALSKLSWVFMLLKTDCFCSIAHAWSYF